jgi:hypothetical protein
VLNNNKAMDVANKKIEEMIVKGETGVICEWDKKIWWDLKLPKEHRKKWNLMIEGENCPIQLVRNGEFERIPSTQMGDTVESNDGWSVGTVTKYA